MAFWGYSGKPQSPPGIDRVKISNLYLQVGYIVKDKLLDLQSKIRLHLGSHRGVALGSRLGFL